MIDFIKGTVVSLGEQVAVLEQNGIGFRIFATSSSLSQLTEGQTATLYTVLVVREDEISLYGFANADERKLYELLTTVKGVGPKVAINVLSAIPPSAIRQAILTEDVTILQKAPGIGKKSAERIILELKDKLGKISFEESISFKDVSRGNLEDGSLQGLLALGYTEAEVLPLLRNLPKELPEAVRIREVLKALSK